MVAKILYMAIILGLLREETYRAEALDNFQLTNEPYDPLNWHQKQCEKNGDAASLAQARTAVEELQNCISGANLNVDVSPNNTAAMFELLKQFCAKSETWLNCLKQYSYKVKPCLTADDEAVLENLNAMAVTTTHFICVKEATRIREFITSDGLSCINQKLFLDKCKIFGNPRGTAGITGPPFIGFWEECQILKDVQACTDVQLSSCPPPTPGLVRSFWETIREVPPCNRAPILGMSLSGFVLMSGAVLVAITAISF